ncbi:DUF4123 domain-containing protein [Vibrio rhizosphaerae]|uniref:DUF4123 domain-containing protein n=1 Tax=Vibrio rhizosphaerae TaxID=398736 RepID=UPI0009FF408B|nr:DUF4123 domain-containing protein [Vibrio rhizosphaerae]
MKSLFDILTMSEGNTSERKTCYLLFDRIQFPQATEFWNTMKRREDVTWCELLRGSELQHLTDVSPLLIDIRDGNPGETLYYWLAENEPRAEQFGFVGLFDGDFSALRAHWHPWVCCLYPDLTQVMLRFYDPAVLPQWWRILTPAQQYSFQGKHQGIYLPIRDEQQLKLRAFDLSSASVPVDPQTEIQLPLQLTQAQFDRFFYPEQLHSLVETLYQKLLPQYGESLSLAQVESRFHEGMALATEKYAGATELDKETYALYRFYLGDRFDEHPEFQRLLHFYPLRQAIGELYHQYLGREDELAAYRSPGWLIASDAADNPALATPASENVVMESDK